MGNVLSKLSMDQLKSIEKDYISGITYKKLSSEYNISESTLKSWKKRYNWKRQKVTTTKNPRGAPKGNINAKKHGAYAKYLPQETQDILEGVGLVEHLDILWSAIEMHYIAVIRTHKLMYVKDQNDLTKVLKRQKETQGGKLNAWEEEYEIQFAWDKQAQFLKVHSQALGALSTAVKTYDEALHKNWKLATTEQKLRILQLKNNLDKESGNSDNNPLAEAAKRIQERVEHESEC